MWCVDDVQTLSLPALQLRPLGSTWLLTPASVEMQGLGWLPL